MKICVAVWLDADYAKEFSDYWIDARPPKELHRAIVCQALAEAIRNHIEEDASAE